MLEVYSPITEADFSSDNGTPIVRPFFIMSGLRICPVPFLNNGGCHKAIG